MQFKRKSNCLNVLNLNIWMFSWLCFCKKFPEFLGSLFHVWLPYPSEGCRVLLHGAAFHGFEFHNCWAALWSLIPFLRTLKEPHSWNSPFLKEYFPCMTQSKRRGKNRELGPGVLDSWEMWEPSFSPCHPCWHPGLDTTELSPKAPWE